MNFLLKIVLLSFSILISCSSNPKVDISNEQNKLIEKLNHGKELFNKGKYIKSMDEFNYILLNDRGSEIAVDARYYQGETHFELKQYDEAIASYEKFLHYTLNQEKVEYITYKICQCYFNLSTTHSRDQTNNNFAFLKLQLFIDEFPTSAYFEESEDLISILRSRKAEKVYETGRLYLKLKQFDSAIIYFNDVINNYYDTKSADESRISIIFFYLLQDKINDANLYYNDNEDRFSKIEKQVEAELLLINYSKSSNWIKNKIRLYK